MTLRVCLDCTTAYAVGVPQCPHCASERGAEQGSAAALGVYASRVIKEEPMPKITRHGGPSIAEPVPFEERGVLGELDPEVASFNPAEGSEQPSVGSSGETSSERPSTTPAKSGTPRRSRARKTGNRSGQAQTAGSSARSTDGGQADAASETADSADGGEAA